MRSRDKLGFSRKNFASLKFRFDLLRERKSGKIQKKSIIHISQTQFRARNCARVKSGRKASFPLVRSRLSYSPPSSTILLPSPFFRAKQKLFLCRYPNQVILSRHQNLCRQKKKPLRTKTIASKNPA